jgi:hypothetical protein
MNKLLRKKWKLDDLTHRDVELLSMAASMKEKTFFCFGKAWYKLFDLNLVDEDTFVTSFGRDVLKMVSKAH